MQQVIESGTTDSYDPGHFNAQPGQWHVDVNQLSGSPFNSRIRFLKLPGVTVYDNRWGCASLVSGESPPDMLMIGTDAHPETSTVRWCGRKTHRRLFACASEGKAIDFSVSPQAQDVVVLIEPDLLQKVCGAEAVDLIRSNAHLEFATAAGDSLVDLILKFARYSETHASRLQQPFFGDMIQSKLFRALEDCFSHLHSAGTLSPGSRDEAVSLAMLHARESRGHTTAWNMAQVAGVSQRTLEYAFKQALVLTPGKYLVLTRLNGAHHALADADRSTTTVTDIALRWGFNHMGRFSAAYRELFNELPSATLGRPLHLRI